MERQRLNRDGVKSQGAYMEPAADGNWVTYSDAAAQLAAKDAEIAALKANRDAWKARAETETRELDQMRTDHDDATRRLVLAVAEVIVWRSGVPTPCDTDLETDWGRKLSAARAATDADPVLRKMIGGGE